MLHPFWIVEKFEPFLFAFFVWIVERLDDLDKRIAHNMNIVDVAKDSFDKSCPTVLFVAIVRLVAAAFCTIC